MVSVSWACENLTQIATEGFYIPLSHLRTFRANVIQACVNPRHFAESRAPERLAAIEAKTSLSWLATCTS